MGARLVSPTFVGRREALEVGAGVLRRIVDRQPSHFLIGGEAGIGKTRLAHAVMDLARGEGFETLEGGCIALGSGELPYAPFAEALRGLVRRLDREALATIVASDGPILGRIAPVLGGEDGDANRADLESGHGDGWGRAGSAVRGRLLNALAGMLGRLSASSPVLLVVEDLHWADSATLDTLAFLLRTLRDERVGLLLTFRSNEARQPLRPWLGELERVPMVERLELGPLAPTETAELIRAIRGTDPTPESVARIHQRSDGNPFFIEELLALAGSEDHAALTPTLRDILLARLQALPGDSQGLIGIASVAGHGAEVELLAEVAGVAPEELDAPLAGCLEGGVLVLTQGEGGIHVEFRHALIHELAYSRLLPGERVRLHRRYAQALAARMSVPGPAEPGRWAELAHHWTAAGDEPRAFESALCAAEEAERACAFVAAAAQYRRALAGWELLPDPASIAGFDHIELLTRAAKVVWLSGTECQDQVPLLRGAIEEADERSDAVRGALLRGRLGYALAIMGDSEQGRLTYADAMATMPPGPPTPERARLLAGLAQVLMLEGKHRESLAAAEAAVAMARSVGDRRTEGHGLNTLACMLGSLGRGGLAIDAIERSLAIALELADPDDVGRAYANATEILAESGRDGRAHELVREGLESARGLGIEEVWGFAIRAHAVVIDLGLGDWTEAASFARDVPTTGLDPGSEVYALARLVELAVATGAWADAEQKLARMGALLDRQSSEYQYTGPFACARAELALWQRQPRRALEAIGEDLDHLERTTDVRFPVRLLRLGLRACADLAAVARDRRDRGAEAEAVALAKDLRGRTASATAARSGMDGGLALEMAAEEATVLAEETRLGGTSEPAAWIEAADAWLARGWPYQRAYALWRLSEASLARGDRPGAADALQEASRMAARLGARPLQDEIVALSRRARLELDRQAQGSATEDREREPGVRTATDGFGLTPRELDVLELVAQGMTNRQIAAALYISVYTAGLHVSRILGKLDATSRTEAAAKAYRLGLVTRAAAGGGPDPSAVPGVR